MICPFCRESEIGDVTGLSVCPACKAMFEIDDRGECIFLDTVSPRLPLLGQFCTSCGLVQQVKRDSCVFCGIAFNKTIH